MGRLWFIAQSMTTACRLDNLKVKMSGVGVVCSEMKKDWKQNVEKAKLDTGARITSAQKQAIKEYKMEHPGTELSDTDILKNLM